MAAQFKLEIGNSSSGPWTDVTPYIAFNGLKWSRNDIDAANSGRGTQDGLMHRGRVAIKIRLDVTCRPLLAEEAHTVLQAIYPQWIWVRYYDVQDGQTVVKKMYSNNIPATFLIQRGTEQYWTGIEFPLIQQ